MEPQVQVKLELLGALAQVKAECLPPPSGPPHAHGDAVSSLAGLALLAPPLSTPASGSATPAAAAAAAAPKRSRRVGLPSSDYLGVSRNKYYSQWAAQTQIDPNSRNRPK